MKKFLALIVAAVAIMAVGCGAEPKAESEKPLVAVSIVPEKEFVSAVIGDFAEITAIIPPGNSPENYEPTPAQAVELADADVCFLMGVPTEKGNIMKLIGEDVVKVDLSEAAREVYPDRMIGGGRDPHVWLSPKRVIVMVEKIRDTMTELYPEMKDTFAANAESYIESLKNLDAEMNELLGSVPDKSFIVFHPAFGYLADDYGLTMYALEEEGKEANPKHLTEMVDLAKEKGIKVIFYQAEIDSSQSKAFANEIGGTSIMLSPLAENYIENYADMVASLKENLK